MKLVVLLLAAKIGFIEFDGRALLNEIKKNIRSYTVKKELWINTGFDTP
jgi:hypothetical protein